MTEITQALRALSLRLAERGEMALELANRSNPDQSAPTDEGAAAIVLAGLSSACRDTAEDLERKWREDNAKLTGTVSVSTPEEMR